MEIATFTFNSFYENTYVLTDEEGHGVIIDPGCANQDERDELDQYLYSASIAIQAIWLTHAHIDHILGLTYCLERHDVPFYLHHDEKEVLRMSPQIASLYHIPFTPVQQEAQLYDMDQELNIGHTSWKLLFTPGHSPGSVCFYHEESHQLIGGDVLFRDSIGRTDLPGGHHETLLQSISNKLYTLPDEVIVYPGHGPTTTIGYEKKYNPFVRM